MERCDPCVKRHHRRCWGVNPKLTFQCPCPCWSGEPADPLASALANFLDGLHIVTPEGPQPLKVDYKNLR